MKRTRQHFQTFVARTAARQYKPQQKFLGEALSGILRGEASCFPRSAVRSTSPRKLIHTEKRLSRNLGSDRF